MLGIVNIESIDLRMTLITAQDRLTRMEIWLYPILKTTSSCLTRIIYRVIVLALFIDPDKLWILKPGTCQLCRIRSLKQWLGKTHIFIQLSQITFTLSFTADRLLLVNYVLKKVDVFHIALEIWCIHETVKNLLSLTFTQFIFIVLINWHFLSQIGMAVYTWAFWIHFLYLCMSLT